VTAAGARVEGIRLLVTNTGAPQAYAVIRALRPHAETIVATMEGKNWAAARLAHAANSRLVDRRVRVPSPVEAWRGGDDAAGERYADALLAVCERERIDTIYPTADAPVHLLSRHKERFEARGIVIPVPPHEVALRALDKLRTIEAAGRVGFPAPRTVRGDQAVLERIREEIGFPVVVKPRFGTGALGLVVARDERELEDALERRPAGRERLLVQELVRGRKLSLNLVLDRRGSVVFAFHKLRLRHTRLHAKLSPVSRSAPLPDFTGRVVELLRAMEWVGAAVVEVVVDSRDGTARLMEVNARFPRQLWNRTEMGFNEPLLCLQIARGEAVAPLGPYPIGVTFVNPVEDVQLLGFQLADLVAYKLRRWFADGAREEPFEPPRPAREIVGSFRATYRAAGPRVIAPCVRHALQDPLVSVLWWLAFATWVFGERHRLGA
jgi:carbamoyl-phosphate synthase large subunit